MSDVPKYEDTSPIEDVPKYEDTIPHDEVQAPSELKSGALGALQGAAFGFADEIEGGLKAAGGFITGEKDSLGDLYRRYRDVARKQYEEAEKANPKAYLAGNVGGGLATALIPGVGAGLASAKGAVAAGAAAGLGSSKAEIFSGDPSELKQAAVDTGIGAGAGIAGKYIGDSLGKVLSRVGAKKASEQAAEYAVGINPLKKKYLGSAYEQVGEDAFQRVPLEQRLKGIGSTLVDESIPSFTGGSPKMYNNVVQKLNEVGSEYKPVIEAIKDSLSQHTPEEITQQVGTLTNKLNNKLEGIYNKLEFSPELVESIQQNVAPILKRVEDAGVDVGKLNEIKQKIWATVDARRKNAFDAKKFSDDPITETLKVAAGNIESHIQDISKFANPEAASNLMSLNKRYGDLQNAADSLIKQAAGDEAKTSIFSAKNLGLGTIAAALHNPLATTATLGKIGLEKATKNPIERLGAIGVAKLGGTKFGQESAEVLGQGAKGLVQSQELKEGVINSFAPKYDYDSIATRLDGKSPELAMKLRQAIQSNNKPDQDKVIFIMKQQKHLRPLLNEGETK